MKRFFFSALAVGISIAAACATAAESDEHKELATRYKVREIPPPDDPRCEPGFQRTTYARRLNEKGQAAGYDFCHAATGDPAAPYLSRGPRAFRWSRSSGSTQLPSLTTNPGGTYARDINDSGTVVGWEVEERGFRAPMWPLAGGVADAIDPSNSCADPIFGQILARAEGINERGSIAASDLRLGEDGRCRLRWVLKRAAGDEIVGSPLGGSLFAINNRDVMVGSSGGNAVKWSPAIGEIVLASGGVAPLARALAWNINDRNEVVGYLERYSDDGNCLVGTDARFWAADGTERALPGLPGAPYSTAFAINRRGQIVGYVQFGSACAPYDPTLWRAVIWRQLEVVDLNTLIPRSTAREIQLITTSAINDHGQILARGIRPADPEKPCPNYVFDPTTEQFVYDSSLLCHSEYSFLLTPAETH